jgi:hypothetical protein
MQIGIPMFFVYLLYRYRVPALARYKKRCHQLRRVLDTVDRESHGLMDELATFLNTETSEDLTYEQLPCIVLEKVISYLGLSVITPTAAGDGTSPSHGFLLPSGLVGAATKRYDSASSSLRLTGTAAVGRAASGENAAAAEREAKIDALLLWGGKQEERRLTLASKLKWESYDSQGLDTTHLTDRQAEERLAYERCGFIFAMYHADTWWCEVFDLGRKLVLVCADKDLIWLYWRGRVCLL